MRNVKSLFAMTVLAAGVASLMVVALPSETPVQKADRAFCNELLKSQDTREACSKVTGISNNVSLQNGRIVWQDAGWLRTPAQIHADEAKMTLSSVVR